ncbi:MAG TPA: hypothetical protein VI306_21870 [Pyrinomonadaceae bacterium]
MSVVSDPLPDKGNGAIPPDSLREESPKQKWAITAEALEKFLAVLSPDYEEAGKQYEALRIKLIRYFEWKRCDRAEELADLTLDRIVRKIDEGQIITNLKAYTASVAKFIALENLPEPLEPIEDHLGALPVVEARHDDDDPDPQVICFDRCLDELPPENRKLLLAYYQDQGRDKIDNRIQLAERLSIPLNALRIRVFRIKKALEKCIGKCLGVASIPK